ncbi:MAG: hypothetical protein J6B89_03810 [Bacilli bacterium]|nr:hypothetical protein [Bacilli bacterium]
MEKEKKDSGKTIIITLLVIIVIVLSAFIVWDKVLKPNDTTTNNNNTEKNTNNKKEENTEESKKITLDTTSPEVLNLFNTLDEALGIYWGNFIYFTDKKFEAKDFTNDYAYRIAVNSMNVYDANSQDMSNRGKNFTEDQLNERIKEIFGKDYKFEHKNYATCPAWEYNKANKTYEYQGAECGGSSARTNLKRVVRVIKTDNTIETYVRVLFATGDKYYKDYNKTIEVTDLEEVGYGIVAESDKNLAKGSLYKVIFTNEDGHYVFTSSELAE